MTSQLDDGLDVADLIGRFPAADVFAVLTLQLPERDRDGVVHLVGWVTWSQITQPDLRTAMPVAAATLRAANPQLCTFTPASGPTAEQIRQMRGSVELRRPPPDHHGPGPRPWISFDLFGPAPEPVPPVAPTHRYSLGRTYE